MHKLLIASLRALPLYLFLTHASDANLPPIIDIYPESIQSSEVEHLHHEIQALQKQLQEAHEKIKAQTLLIEKLESPKKAIKKTLFQRLRLTKAQPIQTVNTPSVSKETLSEKDWEAALQLIKTQQYTQAINAFQKFIKKYPKHTHQPKAYYFLAQLELLKANPKKSLHYSKLFLKRYPSHKQTPEVQFCMGLAYYAQRNHKMADQILHELIEHHPNEPVAQKAREHLKQLQSYKKAS